MNQPETLADIDSDIYAGPTGAFLVAEESAQLIGCGAIYGVSIEVCEVKRMYVVREGRRRGVGRQVLGKLLAFASEAGYTTVRLSTNKALAASHRLYESAGFVLVGSWDCEAEDYVHFYARELSPTEPTRA